MEKLSRWEADSNGVRYNWQGLIFSRGWGKSVKIIYSDKVGHIVIVSG